MGRSSLLTSWPSEPPLARTLCFSRDPGRPVRLSGTLELPVPRTPTPSPSPEERDARSRRPEAGGSPEVTRSKLQPAPYLCILVAMSLFDVLSSYTDTDVKYPQIFQK